MASGNPDGAGFFATNVPPKFRELDATDIGYGPKKRSRLRMAAHSRVRPDQCACCDASIEGGPFSAFVLVGMIQADMIPTVRVCLKCRKEVFGHL